MNSKNYPLIAALCILTSAMIGAAVVFKSPPMSIGCLIIAACDTVLITYVLFKNPHTQTMKNDAVTDRYNAKAIITQLSKEFADTVNSLGGKSLRKLNSRINKRKLLKSKFPHLAKSNLVEINSGIKIIRQKIATRLKNIEANPYQHSLEIDALNKFEKEIQRVDRKVKAARHWIKRLNKKSLSSKLVARANKSLNKIESILTELENGDY